MISGEIYVDNVKYYFNFLVKEFNFTLCRITIRDHLYYDIEYENKDHIISISYENREDYFKIIITKKEDGKIPSYDDKHSYHLDKLNSILYKNLAKEKIKINDEAFSSMKKEMTSIKFLKFAKQLRLCMQNWDLIEKR